MSSPSDRRDRRQLRRRDLTVRRRQLKRRSEQEFNRSVRPYLGV